MEDIKYRTFKGLFTNGDENDLNQEYFPVFENVSIKTNYLESSVLKFDEVLLELPNDVEVIKYGICYLDDDKLANKYDSDYYRFINDYKQNYEKISYVIYKHNNTNFIKIIETSTSYTIDAKVVYDTVNIEGTLRIYTNKGIYLLSKTRRSNWMQPHIQVNEYRLIGLNKEISIPYTVTTDNLPYSQIIYSQLSINFLIEHTPENGFLYAISEIYDKFYVNYDKYINNIYEYVILESELNSLGVYPHKDWVRIINTDIKVVYYNWGQIEYTSIGEVGEYVYLIPHNVYWIKTKKTVNRNPINLFPKEKRTVLEVLQTIKINNLVEIPNHYNKFLVDGVHSGNTNQDFYIKINNLAISEIPIDVTSICYYIRFGLKDDFEKVAELNFSSTFETDFTTIHIDKTTPMNVYSYQTLGKAYNPDYNDLLTDIKKVIFLQKIAIGLSKNQVYLPAVGNGMVYKDIFYSSNVIQEIDKYVEDIIRIGNDIGIVNSDSIEVISIKDDGVGGLITFKKNILEHTTKNKYQRISTPEGIFIATPKGLFATDGSEDKLISLEINDIIERNIDSLKLFYDIYSKYLLVFTNNDIYLYDFLYGYWSKYKGMGIIDEIYNYDDKTVVKINNKYYAIKRVKGGVGKIKTAKTDFGLSKTYKYLSYITFDFEGMIKCFNRRLLSDKRTIKNLLIPLENKSPSLKSDIEIEFEGNLYGFDIKIEGAGGWTT